MSDAGLAFGGARHASAASRDPLGSGRAFQDRVPAALADAQLRQNLSHATRTIRQRRERAVAELPDWEELREAGRGIKAHTMRNLDRYLIELERSVERAGGIVHWASDGDDAARIVGEILESHGAREVIKAKSLTTDEIALNDALRSRGITALETDLAELILQLDGDTPSHILVPALHRNRTEIRDLFRRVLPEAPPELSDDPAALVETVRAHLRGRMLSVKAGISGVNFAVAETGTIVLVESEGNARMCTTLPDVLISIMGIEKVIPTLADLEVFLQLLPRSATAERMNPYTSLWAGRTEEDGPEEFHLLLLDNGRAGVLADSVGRQALHCIRCSACLNVCPVYERAGGHSYDSVYPGPIGAILTPMLSGLQNAGSLPYASSLCGACYEVCPVKINIPEVLVHLRARVVSAQAEGRAISAERTIMSLLAVVFRHRALYVQAQRLARLLLGPLQRRGRLRRLGGLASWTRTRDLAAPPEQSFREWWEDRSPK